MAFDGDIQKFTKAKPDVFSLAGLIAWLETQEPTAAYDYGCIGDCLLHRYFRASGLDMPVGCGVGGHFFYEKNGKYRDLPPNFNDVAVNRPRTYGGALSRARKVVR